MNRSILILLALVGAALAQDLKPAIGSWRISTRIQGRERLAMLIVSVGEDGKLQGVWKGAANDSPISDVTFADGTLKFVRSIGQRSLDFKGTIKDGKLKGEFSAAWMPRAFPSTGRRLSEQELNDPEKEFERNSMRAAPRDAFPVLDNPKMTSAAEAKIKNDAWVIGVVVKNEAKAYPVRVMGVHELVNDTCGGEPIAASW